MTTQQKIPALACSLQGGYLIEASAGTGKTWTLTGIMLRLLIEKQYPPEKVIATTFTRAAASEMQERIKSRLSAFYRYLFWLNSKKSQYLHWFDVGIHQSSDIDEIMTQICQEAKQADILDYDDDINLYLIRHLLTDKNTQALDVAIRRISLLLSTLDKLFIGTLDSLAQKWLKEFAAEISYQPNTQISTNSDILTQSLIHDALRREHHIMSKDSPRVYQMVGSDIFSDINNAFKAVDLSLQFYHADIDEVPKIDDGIFDRFDTWLDEFLAKDLSVFEPFYDVDYAKNYGMNANSVLTKNFYSLEDIIELIKLHKSKFIFHLKDNQIKFIEKLYDIDNPKIFKKNYETNYQIFCQLPIQELLTLFQYYQQIHNIKKDYVSYLYRKIALEVKEKLRLQLESQAKSTFTFQMVRLTQALADNPSLARHIRHLYPVALTDESQDINGLQGELIRLVYLSPLLKERQNQKKPKGFLLLVGDPKQAIYRFRGGDVTNYNFIKHYGAYQDKTPILKQHLSLTVNRRSNSKLIDVLNHWFLDNKNHQYSIENHACLGEDIFYTPIIANNSLQRLSWQNKENHQLKDYLGNQTINVLHLANHQDDKTNLDEYQMVALHINSILQSEHTIQDNGVDRKIQPTDIAILSRDNKSLHIIKKQLDKLNIPSISPSDVNIFTTKAANDFYALLSAMIDNNNAEKLGLLLTSPLFGIGLNQSIEILTHHRSDIVIYLKYAKDIFFKYGIASALNYCLLNNPLKNIEIVSQNQERTLWQQIAKQGERYLTDIWQLSELIIRQSSLQKNLHEMHLLSWFYAMMTVPDNNEAYKQQILPSETGVSLMSIHKSKGLEFSIVYIMGLEKSPISHEAVFYPYSDKHFYRRISPTQGTIEDDEYFKNKSHQEQVDESKRLGYVALTRASEQIFIVAKDLGRKSSIKDRPLFLWFENEDKTISVPKRLVDKVGFISMCDCRSLIKTPYHTPQSHRHLLQYQDYQKVYQQKEFYAAASTSASALMRQFDDNKERLNSAYDEENKDIDIDNQIINNHMIDYPKNDIRVRFEKGTSAGIFLHQLLQYIDPNDKSHISEQINHLIKTLGFSKNFASNAFYQNQITDDKQEIFQQNHQDLLEWVWQIAHVPMISSRVALADLQVTSCVKEMSFVLGLDKDFGIKKLNHIFKNYDDKMIVLNEDNDEFYYKFLKGEIDLVYEYLGKFYIVDYKSNFIGNHLSDYRWDNLEIAMQKSGYWLQACVYQVALHRLLKIRIKDYVGNESRYLGEVEFIFLRGIDKENQELGHINWKIPIAMILDLDKVFGTY